MKWLVLHPEVWYISCYFFYSIYFLDCFVFSFLPRCRGWLSTSHSCHAQGGYRSVNPESRGVHAWSDPHSPCRTHNKTRNRGRWECMTTQRNQDAIYQPYEWRNLWEYNPNEHALLQSCRCTTQTDWLPCSVLWRLSSFPHQKPITRREQFPLACATVGVLTDQFIFKSIFPRRLTIK